MNPATLNRKLLQNLPFKRKLMLMVLTTSLIILLVACASLFSVQYYIFKRAFARDLSALAEVVAANAVGPVSFHDAKAAEEVVASLKTRPEIVALTIRLSDGSRFIHLGRTATASTMAQSEPVQFLGSHCYIAQPITLAGEELGTLHLRADFNVTYRGLLFLYGAILCLVLFGASGIALLVCSRMQRVIAEPIHQLAGVAHRVGEQRDYSVRATKFGTDEIGQLTDSFNQMLTQIQTDDLELRELNREMQTEIAERISAQASQARLTAILEATPDFVASADPEGRVLYMNCAGRAMIGRGEQDDLASLRIADLHPAWAAKIVCETGLPAAASAGVWHGETALLGADGREIQLSQVIIAHQNADGTVAYFSMVARDITSQKRAQAELDELNRRVIETSRQAGMAEVATGVLHNVGNVLNSVSVSATLVCERLRQSDVGDLRRATAMLRDQNGQLAQFLTTDPKGRLLPEFLVEVSDHLATERDELVTEMTSVGQNIEHIKEIVAMQQNYAKVFGVLESIPPATLVEDAVRMNAAAFERHGVRVIREFDDNTPPVCVDRHKVLQILINLVRNAKHAMAALAPAEKRLVIRIGLTAPGTVAIALQDNGIGIAPENLTRIFRHGFTTKKDGHGFGLHSGALAAREMEGRLSVHSEGIGRGATFTLELPAATTTNGESAA